MQVLATPRGTTYLWPHGAMFVGTDLVAEPHCRFTATLCIALERRFRARIGDCDWSEHEALLLAPNVMEESDSRGSVVAILVIDPESRSHRKIAHWFEDGAELADFPPEVVEPLKAQLRRMLDGELEPEDFWRLSIEALSRPGGTFRELDPRIADGLQLLKRRMPTLPSAAELARALRLSEGRLIHLFRQEMGLPFRRYTQWLRIRESMLSLALGGALVVAVTGCAHSEPAGTYELPAVVVELAVPPPPSASRVDSSVTRCESSNEFLVGAAGSDITGPMVATPRGRWSGISRPPPEATSSRASRTVPWET